MNASSENNPANQDGVGSDSGDYAKLFCGWCGESISASVRFCTRCGHSQAEYIDALDANPGSGDN